MTVDFRQDNYFTELKEAEVLTGRIELLTAAQPFIGKYFSDTWVRRNILRQTDEDMEMMDAEMNEDGSAQAAEEQRMAEIEGMANPGPEMPPSK